MRHFYALLVDELGKEYAEQTFEISRQYAKFYETLAEMDENGKLKEGVKQIRKEYSLPDIRIVYAICYVWQNGRLDDSFKIMTETRTDTKAEMILDLLYYGLPADLLFDIFKDEDKEADRQLRQIINKTLQEVNDWREKHPGVQSQFDIWVKNI